jgi:Ring finger domain
MSMMTALASAAEMLALMSSSPVADVEPIPPADDDKVAVAASSAWASSVQPAAAAATSSWSESDESRSSSPFVWAAAAQASSDNDFEDVFLDVPPVLGPFKTTGEEDDEAVVSESDTPPPPPEDNSNVCAICMCEPDPEELARISGCTHTFCFDCISTWADTENSCPLCKARFSKIDRVKKQPSPRKKRKRPNEATPTRKPQSRRVRQRNQGNHTVMMMMGGHDSPASALAIQSILATLRADGGPGPWEVRIGPGTSSVRLAQVTSSSRPGSAGLTSQYLLAWHRGRQSVLQRRTATTADSPSTRRVRFTEPPPREHSPLLWDPRELSTVFDDEPPVTRARAAAPPLRDDRLQALMSRRRQVPASLLASLMGVGQLTPPSRAASAPTTEGESSPLRGTRRVAFSPHVTTFPLPEEAAARQDPPFTRRRLSHPLHRADERLHLPFSFPPTDPFHGTSATNPLEIDDDDDDEVEVVGVVAPGQAPAAENGTQVE